MGYCHCNCMNRNEDNENNNDDKKEIILDLNIKDKDKKKDNIFSMDFREDKEMITDLESESFIFGKVNRIYNPTILIGLANIEAFSYMNPTLQCLSNTDKLTNYFLDEFKYDKDDDTKKISYQYYNVLQHLWDKYSDKKEYAPNDFKKLLSEINPLFSGKNTVYSKDLLSYLLEMLHRELNKASKEEEINNIDNIKQNEEEIKQYFFKDFSKKNNSIISDLFYFAFETKSQCSICNFIKFNFQVISFLDFPLEQINQYLYNKGKIMSLTNNDGTNLEINLYDCFDYYQKTGIIDGDNKIYCNACNGYYDSNYSTTLYSLPEILAINLDRGKNEVYQCNVNFPEELDLTNYVINKEFNTKYELYGVICHIGPSPMSGYIAAYCRNRMDNKWYLYNDSIITLCEKSYEYLNKMPYILFYKSIT